jgi:import receptor subunit TOM20
MSARSATQIVLLTAATAVTGLVGYAVYFDYMRRNNPDFRKSIRKWANGRTGERVTTPVNGGGLELALVVVVVPLLSPLRVDTDSPDRQAAQEARGCGRGPHQGGAREEYQGGSG